MVDSLTSEQRHRLMSRIRSKDTKPEMLGRRLLFTEGYRYRLYAGDQDTVAQSLRGFLGPPGPPP